MTPSAEATYRVEVGNRTFDVGFEAGRLVLDGRPVEYTFEKVAEGYYLLQVGHRSVPVTVEHAPDGRLRVTVAGHQADVSVRDARERLLERFGVAAAAAGAPPAGEVRAPMPGLVLEVTVGPGARIEAGSSLVVLEAMKMENELCAPADAVVRAVHVAPGAVVARGDLLVELDPLPATS